MQRAVRNGHRRIAANLKWFWFQLRLYVQRNRRTYGCESQPHDYLREPAHIMFLSRASLVYIRSQLRALYNLPNVRARRKTAEGFSHFLSQCRQTRPRIFEISRAVRATARGD